MSQSFINHRMFVAALNHDENTAGGGAQDNEPSATRHQIRHRPDLARREATDTLAGGLLANALLKNYTPAAS